MMRLSMCVAWVPTVALAACGPGSGLGQGLAGPPGDGGQFPTTASVQVTDVGFSPVSVTVSRGAAGARVTWAWVGDSLHDVTFDQGGPNGPAQRTGTFVRVFADTGTVTYTCTIHGRLAKVGQVIVR